MKKILGSISILFFFVTSHAKDPVDYVNPHIGGISHLLMPTFNTVHLPNSMVRFNPVKSPGISDHYVASKIYGLPINFPGHRQKHILTLMPSLGELDVNPEVLASEYDHDFETVTPYYYSVLLEDDEITAEFAPAERSAMYRITAPTNPLNIVLRGEDQVEMKIIDDNSLTASELINGTRQYAYLLFNMPFQDYGGFVGTDIKKNQKEISGNLSGLYLTFPSDLNQAIEIKYGVSFISYDQARVNLEKEIGDRSFEEIKRKGWRRWNDALGQITVTGGTECQKTVFYTALYRTLERMVNINENGRYYSAYDQQIHEDERPFYVDDWSWDSYRAHHPLRSVSYTHLTLPTN